jgi:hypothetical protein
MKNIRIKIITSGIFWIIFSTPLALAEDPALKHDLINQSDIETGALSLNEILKAGLLVYTTPFNRLDGYGDGPPDSRVVRSLPGNRPGLQTKSIPFLRVNGLDAQTCLECHSVLSRASIPMKFSVGGFGGANNNAIFLPKNIDVSDSKGQGFASFDGRFINPPFNFGGGGIELLAKEMTVELQEIKAKAQRAPSGTIFDLNTKGISFGKVSSFGEGEIQLDIAGNGFAIDDDLIVRPFGRKGEFATIRAFDQGAMQFHFGMQASEIVGEGVDADNDGVSDEVTVGEMSALHVFLASLPRPRETKKSRDARTGEKLFTEIGCSRCHIPKLVTNDSDLPLSFPEVPTDPWANVFITLDLSEKPLGFRKRQNSVMNESLSADLKRLGFNKRQNSGVEVGLFADLKRHHMGKELAESTANKQMNPFFTTARLWGVADTAPYLHDGRSMTLSAAIIAHGGEAKPESLNFMNLSENQRHQLIDFLRTLRTPKPRKINRFIKKVKKNSHSTF